MKKKLAILLLAACTLTACGSKAMITTDNEKLENAVYNNDSVSLADYTGLEAEKKIYTVSEEAVKNQIHEQMMEFADYKSVSRASQNGDWVYTDYKASINGSVVANDNDYDFIIGAAEFGEEFDEKITGVTAGDKLDFSLNYETDFSNVEWAGKTVDFEVTINDVQEELLPDATDEFIKENMGYNSYEELATATRQSLADNYETESTNELQENLLQQVIDASSILQYSKEDYDTARETIESGYQSYAEMFGMEDLNSLYESLEMTKEDVEEEIQSALYRSIVVNAIIESEKLTLSDSDYENGIAYYMKQNEYEDKDEFLKDYGEDVIRKQLLEDMALNFLVNHAKITEVKTEYEDS